MNDTLRVDELPVMKSERGGEDEAGEGIGYGGVSSIAGTGSDLFPERGQLPADQVDEQNVEGDIVSGSVGSAKGKGERTSGAAQVSRDFIRARAVPQEDENKALKRKLVAAEEDVERERAKRAEVENQRDEVTAERDRLKERLEQEQKAREMAEAERDDAVKEIEGRVGRVANLRAEVEGLQDKLSSVRKRLQILCGEADALRDKLERSLKRGEKLAEENRRLHERNERLAADVGRLQKGLKESKAALGSVRKRVARVALAVAAVSGALGYAMNKTPVVPPQPKAPVVSKPPVQPESGYGVNLGSLTPQEAAIRRSRVELVKDGDSVTGIKFIMEKRLEDGRVATTTVKANMVVRGDSEPYYLLRLADSQEYKIYLDEGSGTKWLDFIPGRRDGSQRSFMVELRGENSGISESSKN